VDTDNLYRVPFPAKVLSAERLLSEGKHGPEFYKGFIVMFRFDPRSILGTGGDTGHENAFPFEFRLVNDRTIVVTAPALDYHDEGGDDATIDRFLDAEDINDNVVWEAIQHARRHHKDLNLPENKMYYQLNFPSKVTLSSEVLTINDDKKNGLLTIGGIPTTVEVDALNDAGPEFVDYTDDNGAQTQYVVQNRYFCGCIYAMVADLSQGTRKLRGDEEETPPTAAAAAMFGRMRIG
jgi:hypothetical protein